MSAVSPLADARAYVARRYTIENVSEREREQDGWEFVVYLPGTAQRMTAGDLIEFARNLRYFG